MKKDYIDMEKLIETQTKINYSLIIDDWIITPYIRNIDIIKSGDRDNKIAFEINLFFDGNAMEQKTLEHLQEQLIPENLIDTTKKRKCKFSPYRFMPYVKPDQFGTERDKTFDKFLEKIREQSIRFLLSLLDNQLLYLSLEVSELISDNKNEKLCKILNTQLFDIYYILTVCQKTVINKISNIQYWDEEPLSERDQLIVDIYVDTYKYIYMEFIEKMIQSISYNVEKEITASLKKMEIKNHSHSLLYSIIDYEHVLRNAIGDIQKYTEICNETNMSSLREIGFQGFPQFYFIL